MNVNKIRELIKEKGISQKVIAARMGLSGNAISQDLKKGDFKVSVLESIAEILEVPVTYFFDNDISENGVKQVANGHGNNLKVIMNSDDDMKELKAKIKGLEIQVTLLEERIKDKDELINLLKDKK